MLVLALIPGIGACRKAPAGAEEEIAARLKTADRYLGAQRFDAAMQEALSALDLARQSGSRTGEVRALAGIVDIDIMASRDEDAWQKALEAESLAREAGLSAELAEILIAKAKLCSYAEISPETGRNDEGLEYAREALSLAESCDAFEQQAEACYIIGSLYINKNRWSDPIDPELYRTAGAWLDRGQALADTYDIPRLRRNGILFRSRWFQQGGRNEEAIAWFEQVRSGLKETDHLTAAALDDRLVRLYTRTGAAEKALDTHDAYVYHMQEYLRQKQDEALQEMETRYEVQLKEQQIERSRYQIWILVLALLLSAAVILLITDWLRKAHRRAEELQKQSDSKEQIIDFLSKDLRNPVNAISGEIARLSADAALLPPEAIRKKCQALAEKTESMNAGVADYVGDVLMQRSRRIADIGLSQREIEIIRLSAEGLKAADIAGRIHLSVHTVNTHRQRIYAKMDVKNVSEMLRKSTELGII